MTLLDLMATLLERKGLVFKLHEFADVPSNNLAKEILDDITEKEFERWQDTIAMSDELNYELKEHEKGMVMGTSLDTYVMQLGTYVMSQEPTQKRKKDSPHE